MESATVLLAIFASAVSATRYGAILARETPHIPGYFAKEAVVPRPTSPPQAVRQLIRRDAATCGWSVSDGAANVCGDTQYCTTSADGSGGWWNCCNTDSCYTQTACSYSVECINDTPYCDTTYMTDGSNTYSRFMCATEASIIHMVYSSEDTPQYTSSVESVSSASAAAASSASAASKSAADASKSGTATSTSATGDAQEATTTSTAPATSSTTSDSGLSGGAIAGIAIGALAGVAIIAALAFFVWRSRRKTTDSTAYHPAEMGGSYNHPAEMAASPGYHEHYKPHGYGDTYAHVQAHPQELPSEHVHAVHELGPAR